MRGSLFDPVVVSILPAMPIPMRTMLQALACLLLTGTAAADPFFQEGDSVLVIGNRFGEALGERSILEQLVEQHAPGLEVQFQHSAASGVEAGDLAGAAARGHAAPDVLVVCIGLVDSLRGDSHLARFRSDLQDSIDAHGADRVVIISPIPREVRQGEDPVAGSNHSIVVARYADATRDVAHALDAVHVDVHGPLRVAGVRSPGGRLTHDGIHLSDAGWELASRELAWQLGLVEVDPILEVPSIPAGTPRVERNSIELAYLDSPDTLRELPDGVAAPSQGAVRGPTWDEAISILEAEPAPDPETVRQAMTVLVAADGRAAEAMEIIQPYADPSREDAMRLAALSALDDLPEGIRPTAGIKTVRMTSIPVKMVYDVKRFDVTAGEPVRIVLENPDAQPHNLLILQPGALRAIGTAADAMGNTSEAKARDWVPDSPRILHVMPMIMTGEQGELRFMAPDRPGRYPYVCTYPGHWRMMNGVMTVRASRDD